MAEKALAALTRILDEAEDAALRMRPRDLHRILFSQRGRLARAFPRGKFLDWARRARIPESAVPLAECWVRLIHENFVPLVGRNPRRDEEIRKTYWRIVKLVAAELGMEPREVERLLQRKKWARDIEDFLDWLVNRELARLSDEVFAIAARRGRGGRGA